MSHTKDHKSGFDSTLGIIDTPTITFGPVPSRRLGRSLGINNIPEKFCSYSCVYCQVGPTTCKTVNRQSFFSPDRIVSDVSNILTRLRDTREKIDYLTFVSNGEPTLDANLGAAIENLSPFGIRTAVITNSSLLWREDVRTDLDRANWVSVKVDSIEEPVWRKINRPHKGLRLSEIIDGIERFKESFSGELVSETMLVQGINDKVEHARKLADFLGQLNPKCSYISVPIRPPTDPTVKGPHAQILEEISSILSSRVANVECLISEDEDSFTPTGIVYQDILAITSVHPMEHSALENFVQKAGSDWSVVNRLLEKGRLTQMDFEGRLYYKKSVVRKIK